MGRTVRRLHVFNAAVGKWKEKRRREEREVVRQEERKGDNRKGIEEGIW